MENIKKNGIWIAIVLILLLFLGNVFLINKVINQDNKFEKYEQTILALNDTIKHSIKNGVDNYSKMTPEIDINQLTNSEFFKTLSESQQKYYNELSKIKGLIASTKIELEKHGHLLDSLNKGTLVIDSLGNKNICFNYNDSLEYKQNDTTNKFQWNAKIIMKKPVIFDFKYTYTPTITTSFIRQKDKSIIVNYSLDDPGLKVNNINSFIIPIETDTRGPLKKWLDKNKVPFRIVGGSILFLGGGYLGYTLAK